MKKQYVDVELEIVDFGDQDITTTNKSTGSVDMTEPGDGLVTWP